MKTESTPETAIDITKKNDPSEAFLTGIRRPHRHLLLYYALVSLLFGPFFPIPLLIGYFRYRTLEYRFDNEGVTMRWGILFRREISLAYGRLQDIHLASNVVERWLGLARVQLQTAAGSAVAEMTIEGLLEFEEVRDFLYARMHGRKNRSSRQVTSTVSEESATVEVVDLGEVVEALRETTRELQTLRRELARRPEAHR